MKIIKIAYISFIFCTLFFSAAGLFAEGFLVKKDGEVLKIKKYLVSNSGHLTYFPHDNKKITIRNDEYNYVGNGIVISVALNSGDIYKADLISYHDDYIKISVDGKKMEIQLSEIDQYSVKGNAKITLTNSLQLNGKLLRSTDPWQTIQTNVGIIDVIKELILLIDEDQSMVEGLTANPFIKNEIIDSVVQGDLVEFELKSKRKYLGKVRSCNKQNCYIESSKGVVKINLNRVINFRFIDDPDPRSKNDNRSSDNSDSDDAIPVGQDSNDEERMGNDIDKRYPRYGVFFESQYSPLTGIYTKLKGGLWTINFGALFGFKLGNAPLYWSIQATIIRNFLKPNILTDPQANTDRNEGYSLGLMGTYFFNDKLFVSGLFQVAKKGDLINFLNFIYDSNARTSKYSVWSLGLGAHLGVELLSVDDFYFNWQLFGVDFMINTGDGTSFVAESNGVTRFLPFYPRLELMFNLGRLTILWN